ncbi:MAG: hypothetical protein EBT35_12465, partial [Alphaproteobacteria bacterium]|nr:hypothetical protein [Alphaproteobacteria bacterium]
TGDPSMTFSGTIASLNTALTNLVYRANLNYNGSDTLTILTSDLGYTGAGGTLTDSDTVAISVGAVNNAPEISYSGLSSLSVNEDTNLTVSGLSVSDLDSNLASVTISVSNGLLTLNGTTGLLFASGSDGIQDSVLSFSGSPANINTAINNLIYRGTTHYAGSDTLTMTISDLGNSGTGGALTDTETIAITVNAVNDTPVNTVPAAQTVNEDTNLVFTGLSVTDVTAPQTTQ